MEKPLVKRGPEAEAVIFRENNVNIMAARLKIYKIGINRSCYAKYFLEFNGIVVSVINYVVASMFRVRSCMMNTYSSQDN